MWIIAVIIAVITLPLLWHWAEDGKMAAKLEDSYGRESD